MPMSMPMPMPASASSPVHRQPTSPLRAVSAPAPTTRAAASKVTAAATKATSTAIKATVAGAKVAALTLPLPQTTPIKAPVAKPVAASVHPAEVFKRPLSKPVIKAAAARPTHAIHAQPLVPNYVTKAAKLADKKVQERDLASAVNIWSTEIEARPENVESWVARASIKRMIGDYRGAQDDLDHALDMNANNVPALISRAAVRRRLADLRGAAKDIDRAVELAPRNYQAFAERSSLRFALNDMQGAMADYNYAITLNPEMNKQAAKYSYSANSQPQLTIRDAKQIRTSDTKGGEAKSDTTTAESKSSSESKFSQSNHAEAKSSESGEPTQYSSTELAHLNNTAVHEINIKHFADAIKAFERLLEISPNYAHARDNLVIAHNNYGLELAMRKPEEALKQFRAALYLDPSQAAIRKNLSAIMRESGQDPGSADDRLAAADQCLIHGEAEGAFVEVSEALRIRNTPQLREKLQTVLAATSSSDSKKASQSLNLTARPSERLEAKVKPDAEAKTDLKADLKAEVREDLSQKSDPDLPPPTILGALQPVIPESRSAMTTIADLPNATLRTREPVALRPIRDRRDEPTVQPHLESPSASPGFDVAFVKSTLDNPPETVLQVARQLASEGRELDAEALLNRLGDTLRKKSIRGDKAAEQMLENTLEALSELYFKSNRLANAEPTLRELVAIREKTKSPDDHLLGKALAEYSMVLKTLGRTEEASKNELKANYILNQLSSH